MRFLRHAALGLALTTLATALAGCQAAAPRADVPAKAPGRPRQTPPLLTIGQKAPDVELPRLVLTKAEDGTLRGAVGDETVRLSAVWGRKPVCLFLSSYT